MTRRTTPRRDTRGDLRRLTATDVLGLLEIRWVAADGMIGVRTMRGTELVIDGRLLTLDEALEWLVFVEALG